MLAEMLESLVEGATTERIVLYFRLLLEQLLSERNKIT